MSVMRCRRLNRRAAERVLAGDPAAGGRRLHALLAAASAPARPGELAGEEAAVAALHSARIEPRPAGRRGMIRTALATLVTTKTAVVFAATAAVTVGGVVTVTAATGGAGGGPAVIPPAPTTAPTLSRASAEAPSSAGPPPSSVPRTGARSSEQAAPPSAARPGPSPAGLCRAYTRRASAERGKVLESPAFATLITAAGGRDGVDGYCAGLLSSRPTPGEGDDTNEPATPDSRGDKENPQHEH